MALLVTAGVGFLQAAILFGRKAPLLVSLYANSGVETRLAVYGFLANFGARRFPKGERKALWCARRRIPLAPRGIDAPTTARKVGLPPRGGKYFLSARKKVPKKARGTATPEAARPAARYSQISAFRALPCPALVFAQACQSLTAYGSCAHWARAPSRPKLRPAGALRAVLEHGVSGVA